VKSKEDKVRSKREEKPVRSEKKKSKARLISYPSLLSPYFLLVQRMRLADVFSTPFID